MSGRCSETEALALLSPAFADRWPPAAAELTRAIHDNRCRPYCNGVVVLSQIAPRLMVVAQPEKDGWTARIEGTFALGGVKPTDVWEFEIDEVMELRQRVEAAQTAVAATEGARAEAATARAELEQARAVLQAATEQMKQAEARAKAAEARAEAASTTTDNPRRRNPPGPPPKDEWPEEVKAAVLDIALTDPKALRRPNYDALNKRIRTDFDNTNRWLPNDPKKTKKIIREFIQRLR